MITFTEFMQHMFTEADAPGAAPAAGGAPAGGAAPAGGDLGGLGGAAAPAGGDLGGLGGGADLGGMGGGLGGATASVPAPKIKLFNVWSLLQDEKDVAEGKKEPEEESTGQPSPGGAPI